MAKEHGDAVYKRWRTVVLTGALAFAGGLLMQGLWADGAGDLSVVERVRHGFDAVREGLRAYGGWLVAIHAVLVGGVIIMDSRHGERTLSWLFVLALLPVVGLVAYWILGPDLRQAGARRRFKKARRRDPHPADPPTQDERRSLDLLCDQVGFLPAAPCASTEPFFHGVPLFRRMFADLAEARREILAEYYILADDALGRRFRDALVERARAGVRVRLMVDAVGSSSLRSRFFAPLREAGGEARMFHPVALPLLRGFNYRNHRKIVVVDGRVGYTGGFNVADEYVGRHPRFGPWYDAHLRLTGPVVGGLRDIFNNDWVICGGRRPDPAEETPLASLPPEINAFPNAATAVSGDSAARLSTEAGVAEGRGGGDGFTTADAASISEVSTATRPVGSDGNAGPSTRLAGSGPDQAWDSIHRAYFALASMARERLWITSPYWVPGAALMTALSTAALSGVDVRVLIPGQPDNRLVYWCGLGHVEPLLRAGVRMYRYAPGRFVHAKTAVADGAWSTVGTANWDARSLEINFEVQAFIQSKALGEQMERQFLKSLEDAEALDLDVWSRRGVMARLSEGLGRLIAPLA